MQGKGTFAFLGIKSLSGKKDPSKTFFNLNLLQGIETFSVFLDDGQEKIFTECSQYDAIEMEFAAFLRTDRGIPALGLRIVNVDKIYNSMTGEIVYPPQAILPEDKNTQQSDIPQNVVPIQSDKKPETDKKDAKAV